MKFEYRWSWFGLLFAVNTLKKCSFSYWVSSFCWGKNLIHCWWRKHLQNIVHFVVMKKNSDVCEERFLIKDSVLAVIICHCFSLLIKFFLGRVKSIILGFGDPAGINFSNDQWYCFITAVRDGNWTLFAGFFSAILNGSDVPTQKNIIDPSKMLFQISKTQLGSKSNYK